MVTGPSGASPRGCFLGLLVTGPGCGGSADEVETAWPHGLETAIQLWPLGRASDSLMPPPEKPWESPSHRPGPGSGPSTASVPSSTPSPPPLLASASLPPGAPPPTRLPRTARGIFLNGHMPLLTVCSEPTAPGEGSAPRPAKPSPSWYGFCFSLGLHPIPFSLCSRPLHVAPCRALPPPHGA